jgi:hypothetical protein
MAAWLSALHVGGLLLLGEFLVLISVRSDVDPSDIVQPEGIENSPWPLVRERTIDQLKNSLS